MNLNSIKIFVVEDDPFFSSLIKEQLNRNEFNQVQIYNNGQDFLDQIHTAPDLVILDHDLGEMSGIEILRKIKSINPNIQVIFLSGQEDMGVAIKALKYGAYDYLEKDESCLSRLIHLIARIVRTNNIVAQNRNLVRMKRLVAVMVIITIGLLTYINLT